MLSYYENFLISITIEVFAEIKYSHLDHDRRLCASSSMNGDLCFSVFFLGSALEHDSTLGP